MGTLARKNLILWQNCVIKKICAVFPEEEGHIYMPYSNVYMIL